MNTADYIPFILDVLSRDAELFAMTTVNKKIAGDSIRNASDTELKLIYDACTDRESFRGVFLRDLFIGGSVGKVASMAVIYNCGHDTGRSRLINYMNLEDILNSYERFDEDLILEKNNGVSVPMLYSLWSQDKMILTRARMYATLKTEVERVMSDVCRDELISRVMNSSAEEYERTIATLRSHETDAGLSLDQLEFIMQGGNSEIACGIL